MPALQTVPVTEVLFVVAVPLTGLVCAAGIVRASARPRRTAMRVAALALAGAAVLVLLELAAAAGLVDWRLVFRSLAGERQEYVYDPHLGFRHTPAARDRRVPRSDLEVAWNLPASRSDRITVTYDGRGYRNPSALHRADVVLIGDSYVEGHYVSDDETVSRFLQGRLGRPVANLGVAGYGTAQELVVLERDGLPLEPRVVVWFFFEGNDLYNDEEFENILLAGPGQRATGWSRRRGWWRRSFVRNAHAELRRLLHPLVPGRCPHFGVVATGPQPGQKVLFSREGVVPWTAFEQDRWARARQKLRDAARVTRERDVELLLVYVPVKFRVFRGFIDVPPGGEVRDWTLWPLPELFAQFCDGDALTCLDLTPLLRAAVADGRMPHALADTHWSPEGHALVARWIEERLTALGWLGRRGGGTS
jgi:hypothetical protein